MRIEGDMKRVHSSGPHANADGGKVKDGIWTPNDRNMSFVNMPDASHACYCSTNLADIYFTVNGASNVLLTCARFIQSPRFQSRYAEFICRGRRRVKEGKALSK